MSMRFRHRKRSGSDRELSPVRERRDSVDTSKMLKRNFASALAALLIAFLAMAAATFAWYIYNTSVHTTNVHMAAGASASLQIANSYDGDYGSAAVLDEFTGTLNPVSTDKIANGFQKVFGFTNGSENQPTLVASLFGPVEANDYYRTNLFLKTNGEKLKVYLSDIGYEDDDENRPISTAIRIGIVPHTAGQNQPVSGEYIFAINDGANPEAQYNTEKGEAGYVLDSTKTDGTTVPFTPYNSDYFCIYHADEGTASLKEKSLSLCTRTLKNLALSFAGFAEE